MEIVSEIPLKLTRKCVDVFGMDSLESESERRTVCKYNYCNLIDECMGYVVRYLFHGDCE